MSSRVTAALLLCACFLSSPGLCEVSIDFPSGGTIVFGTVTEDPDPFGLWIQLRPISPNQVLNAGGDARGDGPPDVAIRSNHWPLAVWSYNNGLEHDIAFSEWDGASWKLTEFLSSGVDNDLDPRIHAEADGTLHVVWWRDSLGKEVFVTTREPGSTIWSTPDLVATSASRPSVVTYGGDLWVAFERSPAQVGTVTDVVISKKIATTFQIQHAIGTPSSSRLDPIIHSHGSHLWVDWKHDSGLFGSVEYEGSWGSPMTEPSPDGSWIGVEGTRRLIRRLVLD